MTVSAFPTDQHCQWWSLYYSRFPQYHGERRAIFIVYSLNSIFGRKIAKSGRQPGQVAVLNKWDFRIGPVGATRLGCPRQEEMGCPVLISLDVVAATPLKDTV